MKCRFCGRELKARISMERGYGEVCGRKNGMIKKKEERYMNLFDEKWNKEK